MGHPDLPLCGETFKQDGIFTDLNLGFSVFTCLAARDLPAESLHRQLHSVADAENRNAKLENRGIAFRSSVLVNTCGPAAQDNSRRRLFPDFIRADSERNDPAVNMAFTDPARDQLTILGTEIKHQYVFAFRHRRFSLLSELFCYIIDSIFLFFSSFFARKWKNYFQYQANRKHKSGPET